LFDIAFHNDGGPTQIREIAEREMIPARFLEQIFQDLKKAGILGAKRGPRGGYHLARPASAITIGDVFRALEGPIVVCPADDESERGAPRGGPDATSAAFKDLAGAIEKAFDDISIADVVQRGEDLGLRRGENERVDFII